MIPKLISLATIAFLCASTARAASPQELAEKMLSALGGRSAWAAVKATANDSQQNRKEDPPVVRTVITMDFERPRFRIESTGPGLHLVRVIDGEHSWRLARDGSIGDIPESRIADDLRWYSGHVYRTIHRVAVRDPRISLRHGKDGRLEVLEDDKRIAWFALDVRGEPYAFGAHDDDTGRISGPWEFEEGGIRHPLWVSSSDGTWRVNIKALKVNPAMDERLFARPASDLPSSARRNGS